MVEPTKYTLFCRAATRRASFSKGSADSAEKRYQSWAAGETIQSETKSA